MKKYQVILGTIAIVAALTILLVAFFWGGEQPTQQLGHVYHVGNQIPNTYFTFGGFKYQYPPIGHPQLGSTPEPTTSPTMVLCAVFNLNAAGEAANKAPDTHHSVYPSAEIMTLNPKGNTTTDLGSNLEGQFYTIVAYNEKDQTITMVYG
jgi:hypothetical protein